MKMVKHIETYSQLIKLIVITEVLKLGSVIICNCLYIESLRLTFVGKEKINSKSCLMLERKELRRILILLKSLETLETKKL